MQRIGNIWRGGFRGKLGIGCGGLVVALILCGLIAQLSGPSTTARATQTVQAQLAAGLPTNTPIPPTVTLTPKPTDIPQPTNTPKPPNTPIPPSVTLGPEQKLRADADKTLENVKAITVTDGIATIEYDLGTVLNSARAIEKSHSNFKIFAPKAFMDMPGINTLDLRAITAFTDIYGKDHDEMAVEFIITRTLADKISWDNVDARNFAKLLNDPGSGMHFHSSLTGAELQYQLGQ